MTSWPCSVFSLNRVSHTYYTGPPAILPETCGRPRTDIYINMTVLPMKALGMVKGFGELVFRGKRIED